MKTTFQDFQHFCKVVDIFLKALEVTFFVVARCLTSTEGTSYLGGSRECPREIFKIENSEMLFQPF